MNIPKELKYTKSHEWVQDIGENKVRIGITDYAQSELGDIVFVNLPQEGDHVDAGESFGDIESVKAVSDIYSPVTGVVSAINEGLEDTPEAINADSYEAYLMEVEEVTDCEPFMTAAEYEEFVKAGG